jgi:predicted nuclease of predicted toxin-antitoxin system
VNFKLDENVPWVLKGFIEGIGDYKVDSVFHEQLTGIDDQKSAAHCLREKKSLITLDNDFANHYLHLIESIFGAIILRPISQGKKAVSVLFEQFFQSYSLEDAIGKVLIVEPTSIRIRAP